MRNAQGTMAPITQDISEMIDCDSFCAGKQNTKERLKQKKLCCVCTGLRGGVFAINYISQGPKLIFSVKGKIDFAF